MNVSNPCKQITLFFILVFTLVFISGCSFPTATTQPQPQKAPASEDGPKEEPKALETVKKPTAVYHDFEDVLVPMELKVVKEGTVIVSTPGFRSGILNLKGRVDSSSLFNFFSNNMEKDNWEVVSKIKSPGTTIMVFQKASRCAVITIRDGSIYTIVEIGVAPTISGGSAAEKPGSITY